MSIRHKTSVMSLNLIKQDLTNEVSIAMIDDAIKIIKEAEATEKILQEIKDVLSISYIAQEMVIRIDKILKEFVGKEE